MSTFSEVAAILALIVYCVLIAVQNETVQITDSKFHYPSTMRYITVVQKTMMCIVVLSLWKCYRTHYKLSTNILQKETSYNAMKWFLLYSISIGVILFICGVMNNISLEGNMLTVPTSSAICKLSPIPTLILSVIFLKQRFDLCNILGMFVALIGISFFVLELSFQNHNFDAETHDTISGILLTLVAMIGWAGCDILLKKAYIDCFAKDKLMIGIISFRTTTGMSCIILFCWILFYPQQIDMGAFTVDNMVWITMNSVVTFFMEISLFVVVAFKSPFYASVGSMLSTPLSFIADVYIHDYKFNIYATVGTLFLVLSFLILQWDMNGFLSFFKCKYWMSCRKCFRTGVVKSKCQYKLKAVICDDSVNTMFEVDELLSNAIKNDVSYGATFNK